MTTLLSSEDFLALDFPTPAYLVDPILPAGGISLLYGKPGVGKTQFMLTLAEAINKGSSLFGRWQCAQGPVLFIQADMTSQMQKSRLLKLSRATTLPDTYFVIEEDGSTPLIDIESLSIMKKDLVDLMHQIDPVLTFWDTLRMIHNHPEASDEAPKRVYTAAKRLLPLSHHTFAHHTRKLSREADANEHLDEGFLGHQHWKSTADTMLYLEEIGNSPKRLTLELTKCRTASDIDKKPFLLEMDILNMLLSPTRAASNIATSSESHRLT